MLILSDMDGVLADFGAAFDLRWRELYPEEVFVPSDTSPSFYLRESYPTRLHQAITEIQTAPGFYRDLPPIPGALAGLEQLRELGHDVWICSAPLTEYRNCVREKYEWVDKHLGPYWVRRIILAKDKTLVRGDVLIDDKPEVTGSLDPTWVHVRYTTSYNRHLPGPHLTWENAAEVISRLSAQAAA